MKSSIKPHNIGRIALVKYPQLCYDLFLDCWFHLNISLITTDSDKTLSTPHLEVDHLLGYHSPGADVPHAVDHATVSRPQLIDLLEVLLCLELAQLLLLGKEQLQPLPLLVIHVADHEILDNTRYDHIITGQLTCRLRVGGTGGRGRGGPMMSPG